MQHIEAYVILENIRSAYNVGAIFRTSEAIGVSKIYLVGYTPAPVDRFGRKVADIAKTALGAETIVPWESREDIGKLMQELKAANVRLVAVEKVEGALDYKSSKPAEKLAFIFGNEIDGVSKTALTLADEVVALPMRGMKESLNVGTTVGIVLYRLLDS
jgi:tRNA G18 (ribose-2'-O)-methylase SpoU